MAYSIDNTTNLDTSLVEQFSPIDDMVDTMMGGKEDYGQLWLREHRADLMDQWLAPEPIIEYFPVQESVGIAVPVEGKEHTANKGGVKFDSSYMDVNMRDVGKYFSLEHAFRQRLVDYVQSDEGQELSASLNKLGCKAEDIAYVAIGFVPDNAIYAVARLGNGKVAIYANKDSYKMIVEGAKAEGISESEMMEVAIGEEITHIFRKSKASIKEEKATKKSLLTFYESLSDRVSNSKLKAKYERIVKHLEHDIATVGRYADMYKSDSSKLELILESEAVMEMGMTDEGEISGYVSAKLAEIAKDAESDSDVDAVVAYAKKAKSAKKSEKANEENSEGGEPNGDSEADGDKESDGEGGGDGE